MRNLQLTLLLLASFYAHAQVGIGIAPENIDPSAQLDVSSTTKGFLPPRMNEAQRIAIATPAAGLIIYQTDATTGFWYYNGAAWLQLITPPGAGITSGTATGNTAYWNGTDWVESNVVAITPAQTNTTVNSSLTITDTNTTPDNTYSLRIETPKPMLLSRMSQNAINALSPVEGMTVFNTDAHKLQVYGMITDNQDVLNEIYTGTVTSTGNGYNFWNQSFTPAISGKVVAIEVLIQNTSNIADFLYFQGNSVNVPAQSSFYWLTTVLTGGNQIPVTAGMPSSFDIYTFTSQLATNSFYPGGSGRCNYCVGTLGGGDDLLFRIHISPDPGTYGWQNLN